MKLSKHFTIEEATKSQTAERLGIDNSIPPNLMPLITGVARAVLEPVREHYDIPYSPSSFYRCEALEKAICWGGNDVSSSFAKWCKRRSLPVNLESWSAYFKKKQHPTGNAVDLEVPGVPNAELARWIKDHVAFDQMILEFYKTGHPNSGWLHVSHKITGTNRKEILTFDGKTYQKGIVT